MNKNIIIAALAVVVLCVNTISYASPEDNYVNVKKMMTYFKTNPGNINLLFIQQAKSGSITKSGKKAGCYTLNLQGLNPRVLYFSDRPKRVTGYVSNKHLIMSLRYAEKIHKIYPNVAIQAFDGKNSELNVVAELTNPQYNAQKSSVSYTACMISGKDKFSKIKHLEDLSLFFDPFHPWPP